MLHPMPGISGVLEDQAVITYWWDLYGVAKICEVRVHGVRRLIAQN